MLVFVLPPHYNGKPMVTALPEPRVVHLHVVGLFLYIQAFGYTGLLLGDEIHPLAAIMQLPSES